MISSIGFITSDEKEDRNAEQEGTHPEELMAQNRPHVKHF
jgi:hypothetical protein